MVNIKEIKLSHQSILSELLVEQGIARNIMEANDKLDSIKDSEIAFMLVENPDYMKKLAKDIVS
jgi:hypothetical protein